MPEQNEGFRPTEEALNPMRVREKHQLIARTDLKYQNQRRKVGWIYLIDLDN